jgi:hypothetical protein
MRKQQKKAVKKGKVDNPAIADEVLSEIPIPR